MISIENDYESITYEQPFSSHIYENPLKLLTNYYMEPITHKIHKILKKSTKLTQKIHLTITKFNHKSQIPKYTKRTTTRKNLDNSISLRNPEKQRISTTRS